MYVCVRLNADGFFTNAHVYSTLHSTAFWRCCVIVRETLNLQGQASHRCYVVLCEQLPTINNRVSYHKSIWMKPFTFTIHTKISNLIAIATFVNEIVQCNLYFSSVWMQSPSDWVPQHFCCRCCSVATTTTTTTDAAVHIICLRIKRFDEAADRI